MSEQLLFANPRAQFVAHRAEIEAALKKALDSPVYIQGEAHAAFERSFAAYIGTSRAIGVANGTDALVLALRAANVGPGDEVLAPSHTAAPTISAIRLVGGTPVFIDIDEASYLVPPANLEKAITARTKAIICVHLYGQAADVEGFRKVADAHHLTLIEDCAQAAGAMVGDRKVGSIGDIGCFSFFPTKNLGAIGDGGAVVTSHAAIAERITRMRSYGWSTDRICVEDGMNSRLDEIQAAILGVKLPYLDADNRRRREIAARYNNQLAGFPIVLPQLGAAGSHVFHLYVIATEKRDELLTHLRGSDIIGGIHYPIPTHNQPAFSGFARTPLPVTERIAKRILSLPIYPELPDQDVDRVADSIRAFFS